jgi:DNA-binding NarL/FixJ family response regulator
MASRLPGASAPTPAVPAGLSPREVEVLRLVAAGWTNRAIASALFLSERTVQVHVRNILTKTRTENRTMAAAFARDHHLA